MNIKIRNSNLELLRIFIIILIITHYYSVYGNWNFSSGIDIQKLYIRFISMGGKLVVNLFVLITGFFMIDSTVKNIFKLIKQT